MSKEGEEFAQEAPGVHSAKSVQKGEYIHVYEGELSTAEKVRLLTLAPDMSDNAIRKAFTRVTGQWQNPSSHPNVVTVYDRGTTPRPWIAVEDVDGKPLDVVQADLSIAEIRTIVDQVAEAMRKAHLYNTRHLNLAPQHVWVVTAGGERTALVDDWGLERACRVAAGECPITPFTAPELVTDPENDSEQTDVYGLGGLAYFALTGHPPIPETDLGDLEARLTADDITPPSDHEPALPPAVDETLLEAVARNPGDRHESSFAFQTDFTSALPSDLERDATATDQTDTDEEETTTEQSPTDSATSDESPTAASVTKVDSVDGQTAAILRDAGYETVGDLDRADEEELRALAEITPEQVTEIKSGVGDLLPSATAEESQSRSDQNTGRRKQSAGRERARRSQRSTQPTEDETTLYDSDTTGLRSHVNRRTTLAVIGLGIAGIAGWASLQSGSAPTPQSPPEDDSVADTGTPTDSQPDTPAQSDENQPDTTPDEQVEPTPDEQTGGETEESQQVVTDFDVTNPSDSDLRIRLVTNEEIEGMNIAIDGANSTTLTRSDFEENHGDGTIVYESIYSSGSYGVYEATLREITDESGETSTMSMSRSLELEPGPLEIESFELSNDFLNSMQVTVTSTNQLRELTVVLNNRDSDEETTFTRGDFTEEANNDTYTYTAETEVISFGTYEAQLETATDVAGNSFDGIYSDTARYNGASS